MSEKEVTRISKFLSLILRHRPETIGLALDENGWANVEELIEKMNSHKLSVTRDMLDTVVSTNNKQRFAFNEHKTMIRANQGHSIRVELDLKEMVPPTYLYHGTSEKAVPSIMKTGLQKRERHHVHLSQDIPTAIAVGRRHGKPIVFCIAAQQMHQDGYIFYLSENNVWLTDFVPVQYLKLVEPAG